MAPDPRDFLGHVSSDESGNESGYDSEAAEISKSIKRTGEERTSKRRKLSPVPDSDSDSDIDLQKKELSSKSGRRKKQFQPSPQDTGKVNNHSSAADPEKAIQTQQTQISSLRPPSRPPTTLPSIHNGPDLADDTSSPATKPKTKSSKPTRPGVIYLSSLPPYLRPSALRNLLSQRGFSPITRLFLTPASASKSSSSGRGSSSKSNTRQLYSEGWLEFASHKTAKKCAQTLNASPVGGKKGGYYRDDLWNMRYLKGMAWGELMSGVQGERREEEARRDEERRVIAREQRGFVEGVERGRRWEGMQRKRRRGGAEEQEGWAVEGGQEEEPKRTWRQFEVQGKRKSGKGGGGGQDEVGEEAREVLAKIF